MGTRHAHGAQTHIQADPLAGYVLGILSDHPSLGYLGWLSQVTSGSSTTPATITPPPHTHTIDPVSAGDRRWITQGTLRTPDTWTQQHSPPLPPRPTAATPPLNQLTLPARVKPELEIGE